MLGWEIPPLLEENPTHTYDVHVIKKDCSKKLLFLSAADHAEMLTSIRHSIWLSLKKYAALLFSPLLKSILHDVFILLEDAG